MNSRLQYWLPFMVAMGIALLFVIYYVATGRYQFDRNVLQLEQNASIRSSENTVLIQCKNGESYEIVYQPGQSNFENLVYDKCGAEGQK